MFAFYLSLLLAVIPRGNDGAIAFTKTPPPTIYAMEGSDAVFVWEFYVDKKPADVAFVSWNIFNETQKDFVLMLQEDVSGKLEESPDLAPAYKGRLEKKDQATLVVKTVTPEDAVSFRCILTEKTGLLTKSTVTLVVTGPATVSPRIQFGNIGDTVTITCNVSGVPSENITWTRQLTAEKIVNSSQHLITSRGIGSSQLTIKDISIDNQAGYYVCDGTVNVDQPNSATCYLQVQFLKSEGPYDVTICGSQTITCPVTGYSPPIVTWEKNGNQLQKGENTSLSITSMMDSGIYTCTATNVVSSSGPINIGVVKKCVNLSLSCIDGTAEQPAKLNWSPPVGAKYYVVEIAGGDVLDDRNLVIGATTSLEIHYLTLVMKKADEKPKETEIRVQVSAMDDQRVLVKAACEKLTLKKPSDVNF